LRLYLNSVRAVSRRRTLAKPGISQVRIVFVRGILRGAVLVQIRSAALDPLASPQPLKWPSWVESVVIWQMRARMVQVNVSQWHGGRPSLDEALVPTGRRMPLSLTCYQVAEIDLASHRAKGD
jgi:hypothetical protein